MQLTLDIELEDPNHMFNLGLSLLVALHVFARTLISLVLITCKRDYDMQSVFVLVIF